MSNHERRPDALYLALDQGGHGSRAIVFDAQGQIQASASYAVAVQRMAGERVEQDPQELVDSLRRAAEDVVRSLGGRATQLASAGLATQRSSIVCWDRRNGRALSPVISWQDRRAHAWLDGLLADQGSTVELIHRATGLYPNAHFGASKLRWCLDHLPEVAAAHADGQLVCGPLASFLAYRLVEERPILVDPANAGRTVLWNLHAGDWDSELLRRFAVPSSILPRGAPSLSAFGHIKLAHGDLPLRLVTGDQSAALFAHGLPNERTAVVNVGTGAFVQRRTHRLPADAGRLLRGVVYQDSTQTDFVVEGTVNGAGSALKAWAAQQGIDEAAMPLDEWLAATLTPPLFINGVSGLGSPDWLATLPSRFVGEGEGSAQAVAIAESIVFLLQRNLEAMRAVLAPPTHIQISGGLSRVDGLCQRLADLAQCPVVRPAEVEASARGVAFLLAGRPSVWPAPGPDDRFTPRAYEALHDRYRRWTAAMNAAIAATRV